MFSVLKKIQIQQRDFDVGEEYLDISKSSSQCGAVVTFVGLVRDIYDERDASVSVQNIELEYYPGMTEAVCEQIVDDAHQCFPFDAVTLIHRVGKLEPNEQIVFVAVASQHRENAFNAAQYIMDYLKTKATFWKREVGSRGSQWLGVKEKDAKAVQRWPSMREKNEQ